MKMTKRLTIILFGYFSITGVINFVFAQHIANNGPEFGFARPLNDPATIDPDPFGRGFSSGSESMTNLESLANMPLDFLGGTTIRPPDFSSNNVIGNISPSEPSFNDGPFLNGNFLNDFMSGTEFQLPPGTSNDILPPNNTITASNSGGHQSEPSIGPELPDLHSVMSMSVPSSQTSTDTPFNRPNRNANIIFPQDLPHEQPPPALVTPPASVSGASSVIRDWLSITSDPVNNPGNRSPVNAQPPVGPPINNFPTINNQPTAGNIVSNENNMPTAQNNMWSHNSLFNNPNLGEPSDLFGNMNIPIDFPIEDNFAQSRFRGQQGQALNNVNPNRVHVNQPPPRAPPDVNIRQSVTRPVLPPPSSFLPGLPAGLPQNPNRRVNTPDVFRIGGGTPRSVSQANPVNRINPMNEQIMTDVFRNPSVSMQNRMMGISQNQPRNNLLNLEPTRITTPLAPRIRPNFNSNFQRIQQQQQPLPNDLSSQQTAINSFAPLPLPRTLPQQFDQNRMIQDSSMISRSANPQIRPIPVNNLVTPTMNNPLPRNVPIPSNIIPTNSQRNPLVRSIPVENGNAARFITGQRSLNRNAQLWSGIENRSRNFGEQASVFPSDPTGRRATPAFGIPPQIRGNQRQPQSLRQGLQITNQRRQRLRNISPTLRSPFGPPRFPRPSQLPVNRNRVQNAQPSERRRQRQRALTGGSQRPSLQDGPPFDPLLFLPFQDFLQDPLAFELFDTFNDETLLFLQDPLVPMTNNVFNPLLDLSDRRVIPNRRPQFPSRQLPNRMRVDLPLNRQTNTNPFGIRQISPPVAPVLQNEELPFMGSGFFNPGVMMFSDVEVKPSSKKRIKPVSKQNATQNLLEKATMQGLRKFEYINTPVVKENRVF